MTTKNEPFPLRVTRGGRKFWEQMRFIRTCGDKVKHKTREDAEIAQERMEQRTGDAVKVYLCPHCHMYHIGRDHSKIGDRD